MILEGTSATEQVKARLLPLTRFERVLEGLVERLPRRTLRIQIKPVRQIEVLNDLRGEFKSTGPNPAFKLTIEPDTSRGTWLYIEAALVRNNGSRISYLQLELEGAGTGDLKIPIPTNLRGTVREVVYLPPNIAAIYWLPTAAPGFFSQRALLAHQITWFEGALRRMHRVLFDLWRFRNRPHSVLQGLTWRKAFSNLSEAYQSTALLRLKRLTGNDYDSFIAVNESADYKDVKGLQKKILKSTIHPLISLITLVQESNARQLREAIESVIVQDYRHWELLLTGDLASNEECVVLAKEFSHADPRIRIVPAIAGGSSSKQLNVALAAACGAFFTKICPKDKLAPHALLFVVQELIGCAHADLVYTDHDYLDKSGIRCDPYFKPDWNLDLFLSCNYLGGLAVYRTKIALERGGYRAEADSAESYDFTLRYVRDLPSSNIRHVPRILYHMRLPSQATYGLLSNERFGDAGSHNSGKKALMSYFENTGAIVEDGAVNGVYRIRYPLPVKQPLVTIIVPTRDRVDVLQKCVESIFDKTDYVNWELLVVDNGSVEASTQRYFQSLQAHKRVKVLRYDAPFNYSALNNFAARQANGDIFALLNNDVEVISSNWLSEMVAHALRPGAGAIGAKLLYSNKTIQHAGVILGIGGVAGHSHKYIEGDANGYFCRAVATQNFSAVTGACLVVTRKCYEEVGGLNESDLAVAFNDIDFCLRLGAAGYRNVFTPYALLYHHESISRGNNDTEEKQAIFQKEFSYMQMRWGKKLLDDPAYNRNLTREFEDFSLHS